MIKSNEIQVIRTTDERFAINSYCIVCSGHGIIIDPVMTNDLEKIMAEYVVDFSILTHEHYDHICGVKAFSEKVKAPVKCGRLALNGLVDPSVNMSKYVQFLVTVIPFGNHDVEPINYSCHADEMLNDCQEIGWQGHKLFIKETPGHSIGSICVLLDEKYLFSGDAIFKEYPTATRLPGGNTRAFKDITEPWLDSLHQDIIVYPGHTEPFRLFERYNTCH